MPQNYGPKTSYTGGSSGILYTDRRDFYLNPNTYQELYPDVTPFITFMTGLKTVKTADPDFILFEHRGKWLHMNGYIRTAVDWDSSGSWAAAKTSVNTATASGGSTAVPYLTTGDIIEVRAGSAGTRNTGDGTATAIEANQVIARCRVSAVTSGSAAVTLTAIDIDNDGSETFDLAENDPFVIISRGDEEGSRSPEAWSDDLEKVWNSTQIIKTPVEITGTLYNMTRLRGASNELARLRDLKAKEHKMKANRAMMLGVRVGGTGAPTGHLTGASGYPIRTTMGAIPMLKKYGTANEQTFDRAWATYDVDDFIDDMETIAQYDNAKTEKFAFAGSSVLAELAKTGESSFFTRSGGSISLSNWTATSFGFDVRTLTHPFGKLHITWDPSLRYEPYKNTMAIFDPDHIQRVIYRQDQYQTALQENDADMIKDQYFSDCGLGMTLVEKHALFEFN